MARPDRPVQQRCLVRELQESVGGIRAAGPGRERRGHRHRDRIRFAAVVNAAVAQSDRCCPWCIPWPADLLGELGHLLSEFWLGARLPQHRRLLPARCARQRHPAAAGRGLGKMDRPRQRLWL